MKAGDAVVQTTHKFSLQVYKVCNAFSFSRPVSSQTTGTTGTGTVTFLFSYIMLCCCCPDLEICAAQNHTICTTFMN